jgi:hypothetical protein
MIGICKQGIKLNYKSIRRKIIFLAIMTLKLRAEETSK